VYAWFGLADYTDEQVELAVDAAGSKDLGTTDTLAVLNAAHTIKTSGLTGLDVVSALQQCGYPEEAGRLLDMLAARVSGDYLQTAAIFDEQMNVLSLVTDPNDYLGPGTGYEPTAARQAEIDAIRQQRSVDDLRRAQDDPEEFARFSVVGQASTGTSAGEVVIGLSPAVGRAISRTLSGLTVSEALAEVLAGLEEEGCSARLVRINDSIDLGSIGLKAARLAGSGIGIGLQAKGTALIHRRDLSPLANLELYSVAPTIGRTDYRLLGVNAGRHAKGATPDPARNPYSDEAIEARYHTRVVALVAIERSLATGGVPEELQWKGER
jgi:propanediol dehydratase large subunit